MSEIPISPNVWKLAEAILTEKQKAVLELREKRGYSWNQLAITFNCTRANVREHHAAATRNLLNAIEAASGDIDLALETALTPNGGSHLEVDMRARGQADTDGDAPSAARSTDQTARRIGHEHTAPLVPEPRPASGETPEEKLELDRLWKESA